MPHLVSVPPVGVADHAGELLGVVQRGVELGLLGGGAAADADLVKRGGPVRLRGRPHLGEALPADLRVEVRLGFGGRGVGDADPRGDGLVGGGVEGDVAAAWPGRGAAVAAVGGERLVEFDREVEREGVGRLAETGGGHRAGELVVPDDVQG
jgi:hypothetical protein